jgi:hypothetical protein
MSKPCRRSAGSWPSDVLCSELVEVFTKSRIDAGAPMVAIVEAISETEAVLSCEAPMRRGGAILVKASAWSFRARVAGCRKDAGSPGFLVLARFEEPFRWTAAVFSPEHMLDLRILAGQNTASQTHLQPTGARVFTAGQSF